jgi:hypothetical protein
MKPLKTSLTAVAAALSLSVTASVSANSARIPYDIWASDQSNSVAGAPARGVDGSYMWIWNSEDVERQLAGETQPYGPDGNTDAYPLLCDGTNAINPNGLGCDIWDIFTRDLEEVTDNNKKTGETLGSLHDAGAPFGKLHGALPDPQNRYVNVNMFAPNGGYVGIMDGETKEAIALFKVTSTKTSNTMHMTFWSRSGDAIYIANLGGRALERIDIKRDVNGTIEKATFNRGATLPIGRDPGVVIEATAFRGNNAQGRKLRSEVKGNYSNKAFSQLTPNGYCKENGCADGPDAPNGGRPNTVIVCPIASFDDNVYITLGGGGLLVADGKSNPMKIVAEYEQQIFNGAGCGGMQVDDRIWLNAGVSASGAGADQSTFTMYNIDDSKIKGAANPPNTPTPNEVYKDLDDSDGNAANTATIGNLVGPSNNTTGQLPGVSTRRDAHGMTRTVDGSYIHNVDRIQNVVEVFNTIPGQEARIGTYDLTSEDGQGDGVGPCAAKSVKDDENLPGNDPAPDLMYTDPNGDYLVFAARGPIPVSVTHAAQGSCPGVGIIELTNGGSSGKLAGVLRTTNYVDDTDPAAPGGHHYTGGEHSDPHGASIRVRCEEDSVKEAEICTQVRQY